MITKSAKSGMTLWATQLIPALFPFMILTNLFFTFYNQQPHASDSSPMGRIMKKIWNLSPNGIYILLFGHLCGYPSAAKMICDLFKEKKINQAEANYLLTIANQSGPAFIQSYLITYILESSELTIPLCLVIYISTFLTSLITRLIYHHSSETNNTFYRAASNDSIDFFTSLDNSIVNSAAVCIKIGGYIIIFSVLSSIAQIIFSKFTDYSVFISASFELTYGLSLLKNSLAASSMKPFIILGYFSFGGLCTMAQIKGMLIGTSLSIKPYLLGKTIYTIILIVLSKLFI